MALIMTSPSVMDPLTNPSNVASSTAVPIAKGSTIPIMDVVAENSAEAVPEMVTKPGAVGGVEMR